MLYVYFGNDATKVRTEAFAFLHTLTDTDSSVTKVTADTYQAGMLADFAESVSLFGTAQAVVLDMLSENEEIFSEILASLDVLGESGNSFILIEEALNAANKRKIEASATKMHEVASEKKTAFNTFALCDALLLRDKKTLWLLLMEAWRSGATNEELVGILLWQIKILRLAERTGSAEEAGQKAFVYGKAKRALAKFKKGELDQMSRALLTIYHDGHLGKCDMSLALEKWVLQI
jgi:DNA polymerase III delta subunit